MLWEAETHAYVFPCLRGLLVLKRPCADLQVARFLASSFRNNSKASVPLVRSYASDFALSSPERFSGTDLPNY